jgi:tripartite-type tricarboxylate transporter receptor subunit TctC
MDVRNRLLAGLLAVVSTLAVPAHAAYPDHPVTILVPWGAGGPADTLARLIGSLLERELNQTFVVVNRAGGSGVVGHAAMKESKPDGYTLGLATVEITMLHWAGLGDFNQNDFTTLAIVNSDAAAVMVNTDSPYKTAKELILDIKAKPAGTFKASGSGQGGIYHLALAGWLIDEGVDPNKVQWIPSQGGAPAMKDLLAHGTDFVTASLPEGQALIDAGRVRGLANMDVKRLALYPNVPTLKEATGSNWTTLTWRALVGPKGMPKEATERLVTALRKVTQTKEYKDFMEQRGYGITWIEGQDAVVFENKADAEFGRIMKATGLAK